MRKIMDQDKIDLLAKEYPLRGMDHKLAEELGVTVKYMGAMASKLGIRAEKRFWTKEMVDILVAKYPLMGRKQELADELGVTRSALVSKALDLGLKVFGTVVKGESHCWTDEMVSLLSEKYPLVGRSEALAGELGVTLSSLISKAQDLGLRIPPEASRKDDLRLDYFDKWSNNMAWLLGYTFADGSVGKDAIKYACVYTDVELLEHVKKELNASTEISWRIKYDKKHKRMAKPQRYLGVYSAELSRRVQSLHGCLPRKSKNNFPYPFVPDEFLGHFARGVLDGDGGVLKTVSGRRLNYSCGFSWCGGYKFIEGLRVQLTGILDLSDVRTNKNGSIWRVTWLGVEDVQKLYNLMYSEGDYPYLMRKRHRIENLMGGAGLRGILK
jgi:hypothetical protein